MSNVYWNIPQIQCPMYELKYIQNPVSYVWIKIIPKVDVLFITEIFPMSNVWIEIFPKSSVIFMTYNVNVPMKKSININF